MIAPTTLVVAEIFKAVKMDGTAVGRRSFHNIVHREAAYERIRSSAPWSGERKPRKVLIVTGKKAR